MCRAVIIGNCAGETVRTELCKGVESIVRAMEAGNEEKLDELRTQWSEMYVGNHYQYLDGIRRNFRNEKQNLVWTNRMIESRLAVAQQLTEISRDHGNGGK